MMNLVAVLVVASAALAAGAFGVSSTNITLNQPTSQSSLYNENGISEHAVDGNTNGDFSAFRVSSTNIALNQPTSQSSLYNDNGISEHAVDGNTNGDFFALSCTETQSQANPWWAVDLGAIYRVSSVTVYNRADCCASRLHDFVVGLTNIRPVPGMPAQLLDISICHSYHGEVGAGAAASLVCSTNTRPGQFLVVHIPGIDERLTLCEVMAYGTFVLSSTNIALNQPTSQSSLYNENGIPEHAVDGNTNGDFFALSCTETQSQVNPWWAVDLGDIYRVSSVIVYNRADCCASRLRNFVVGLTNIPPVLGVPFELVDMSICDSHTGEVGAGAPVSLECGTNTSPGRFLVVQILGTDERLTLCEVLAYGSK